LFCYKSLLKFWAKKPKANSQDWYHKGD